MDKKEMALVLGHYKAEVDRLTKVAKAATQVAPFEEAELKKLSETLGADIKGLDENEPAIGSDRKAAIYQSLTTFGLEGLKALLLLNGGAVVAMLAYFGQNPPETETTIDAAKDAMQYLGVGLVACVLGFLFAYLTQLAELLKTGTRSIWSWVGMIVSVAVSFVSLVMFCVGAWESLDAIAAPPASTTQTSQPAPALSPAQSPTLRPSVPNPAPPADPPARER